METPTPATRIQYAYFTRSFNIELAMFMLFGPGLIALWAVSGYYYYYSERLPMPLVKSAVYFTTTFIFSMIFYGNARALAGAKSIIVEKDRIIKKSPRRTTFVNCSDITGIRRLKIPFVKRWVTLDTQGGGRFLLPLRVHAGHEMIDRIFGNLTELGTFLENSGPIKDRLRKTARHFGLLHKLRLRNLPNLMRAIAATAVFHGAVAMLYWESTLVFAAVWGATNMFVAAAAYFIAERAHMKKLMSGAAGQGPYLLAGILALLTGMIVAILITIPA